VHSAPYASCAAHMMAGALQPSSAPHFLLHQPVLSCSASLSSSSPSLEAVSPYMTSLTLRAEHLSVPYQHAHTAQLAPMSSEAFSPRLEEVLIEMQSAVVSPLSPLAPRRPARSPPVLDAELGATIQRRNTVIASAHAPDDGPNKSSSIKAYAFSQ
jgi:hypothetical protein